MSTAERRRERARAATGGVPADVAPERSAGAVPIDAPGPAESRPR